MICFKYAANCSYFEVKSAVISIFLYSENIVEYRARILSVPYFVSAEMTLSLSPLVFLKNSCASSLSQRYDDFDKVFKKASNPLLRFSRNRASLLPIVFFYGRVETKQPGHLFTKTSLNNVKSEYLRKISISPISMISYHVNLFPSPNRL